MAKLLLPNAYFFILFWSDLGTHPLASLLLLTGYCLLPTLKSLLKRTRVVLLVAFRFRYQENHYFQRVKNPSITCTFAAI